MARALRLYYDLMSQPSRALWMALRLSKTQFDDCPVALRKREQLTEAYKKINRFQKVPCIIDGDFHLAETVAIYRYLSDKGYLSESVYPRDIKECARVNEFLEWQHLTLRYGCAFYFREMWLFPMNGLAPMPNAEKEKELLETMETNLKLFENLWLEKSKFMANDRLSVADLTGACELEQLRLTKYSVAENFPKIQEFLERVRAEVNPLYDEAHKFIYKYSGAAMPK